MTATCPICGRTAHAGPARALDLALEGYELAPRPTPEAGVLEDFPAETWDPLALALLPVYARSMPTWYGWGQIVMLWRAPVLLPLHGLRWMVGRRDINGRMRWTVAEYGGCNVWGPEGRSPLQRSALRWAES